MFGGRTGALGDMEALMKGLPVSVDDQNLYGSSAAAVPHRHVGSLRWRHASDSSPHLHYSDFGSGGAVSAHFCNFPKPYVLLPTQARKAIVRTSPRPGPGLVPAKTAIV